MILDLMESVAKLEALSVEQVDRFEGLATHAAGMATQMATMATQMATMATRVTALMEGARATDLQLGRVARLIVQLADDHQRIEGLEQRVEKLERKAG